MLSCYGFIVIIFCFRYFLFISYGIIIIIIFSNITITFIIIVISSSSSSIINNIIFDQSL